jgi:hypothetical protein
MLNILSDECKLECLNYCIHYSNKEEIEGFLYSGYAIQQYADHFNLTEEEVEEVFNEYLAVDADFNELINR